jgi:hypothetical protein
LTVRDSEGSPGGRAEVSAHPWIGITILMAMIRLLTKSVWGKVMIIRSKVWPEELGDILYK